MAFKRENSRSCKRQLDRKFDGRGDMVSPAPVMLFLAESWCLSRWTIISHRVLIGVLGELFRCRFQGDGNPGGVWHGRRSPRRRWAPGELEVKGGVSFLRGRLYVGRYEWGQGEHCFRFGVRSIAVSVFVSRTPR